MRSILVFFLWIITCVVSFIVVFPPWMIFVTVPRMFWHTYRNSDIWEQKDWEMPWFPIEYLTKRVKKLDPKNDVDKRNSGGKVWVAGSG